MNKQWQNYVDAAKQQQPLLTQSEVEQLLHKPKAKVVVKKRWLNFKLLLTMSMLTTLFVGLMWLQQPTEKTVNTPQPTAPKKTQSAIVATTEKTQVPVAQTKPIKNQYVLAKKLNTNRATGTKSETLNQKNLPSYFNPPTFTNYTPVETPPNDPERIYFNEKGELVLTYDELAKLGILTDGNVLDYKVITDTAFAHTENGVKKLEKAVFTLHVEQGGRNSLNGILDTLKESFFNKFYAVVIEDSIPNDKYHAEKAHLNFLKTELIFSKGYDLDYFNELKTNLVPVEVRLLYNKKIRHFTFWFKNENSFLNALPDGFIEAIKLKYGVSNPTTYFTAILTKYRKPTPTTKSIDSLTSANLQKKIISVSDEALKELNITRKNDKLKMVFWESRVKNNKTIVERSVAKNKKAYYNYSHMGWRSLNTKKGLQKVYNSPIAVTNYNLSRFTFLRNMDDSIGPFMNNPSYSYFARIAPKLHPIMVDSDNVIWFPDNYQIQQILLKSSIAKAGVNFHKMNKLVLSPEELNKLDINYAKQGIKIPTYKNGKQSMYYVVNGHGNSAEIDGFNFESPDSAYKVDTTNNNFSINMTAPSSIVTPVLLTNLSGLSWYHTDYETEKFMTKEEQDSISQLKVNRYDYLPYLIAVNKAKELLASQLNTFVPIVIKHPDIKNAGAIAWYKPDSGFLSLLPLELSSAIKQELNAINTNNKGASCTYFEACKELGMNWEINAFPNPTEKELNLTIENSVEGKYRIEITDIEGKMIKDLSRDVKLASGKHQLNFDISNLAKGMYLLQVINDKREILVKRIVKL